MSKGVGGELPAPGMFVAEASEVIGKVDWAACADDGVPRGGESSPRGRERSNTVLGVFLAFFASMVN